ncbi:MAG TPA: hypothetical protein EYO78_09660, partial [Gammaproteobacteria bacterium]|nr:hypothetical protein [Gammaproteobacteria bacterium]
MAVRITKFHCDLAPRAPSTGKFDRHIVLFKVSTGMENLVERLYLELEDPDKDISLYINSPGGIISAGLAIYDTM